MRFNRGIMTQFVHLHLHSHFSLLDGMIKPEPLMDLCRETGMNSVAITDHGNMYGVVKFYKAALAKGIKPIIGSEVYVAQNDHRNKSTGQQSPSHLVLLVQNETGYRNLVKLVTTGYLDGFYYRPRCDRKLLEKYSEGLIALSACLKGEVARAILEDSPKKAKEAVDFYSSVFPGRYYIELQENGIVEQSKANEGLLKLAKEFDLPIVATNDCHYLLNEHASSHELLLCIQTGKTLNDEKRMRFSTQEFYVKSPEQMAAAFPDHPEALKNTLEVSERCDFNFEFGNFIYPIYELEEGQTSDSAFEKMTRKGLEKLWPTILRINGVEPGEEPKEMRETYNQRLNEEIDLIKTKDFSSYFLIVQDFINWARDNEIPVGPGRGSAAGSLVSYCLRITDIEPIRYGLLFERFLNPERLDNPDIDIDFCTNGRDRVIEYTSEKYGKDNVAQIATFGTLKAKAAVRDVGRVMGFSYGEVDRIAKLIPNEVGITLDRATNEQIDLKRAVKDESWVAEMIEHAKVLEGCNRHISTHAAGVVIANKALEHYLPLTKDADGQIITQWDKKDVEEVGLIKFDFLGLKTLTVIDNTKKLINEVHGKEIDLSTISMEDSKTFELLSSAKTTGVFQLESSGMKELLMQLKPSRIDDLIALVALYRPGPIGSGMIANFINRKHEREPVEYTLPILEKHLSETYGMIVYQEQVMQVANAVAGFTLGDADLLRRAMAKKDEEAMAKHKVKFIDGANERNIPEGKAELIWDLVYKFASYGFNKSHSAAYGVVAYQTAYLKAHYPVEFMTALLTMDADNSDKLMTKISETREMGIEVLPPDVNESQAHFSVSKGRIRFGLAGVKNVGLGAVDTIIEGRSECGGFKGLFDFCEKIDIGKVNRRVVESLIKAGAFDSINDNRAQLSRSLDKALERAARVSRDKASGQRDLFASCSPVSEDLDSKLEECPTWNPREQLEIEKEVLGFYLTGHPLEQFKSQIKKFTEHDSITLRELPPSPSGTNGYRPKGVEVRLAGIISSRKFIDKSRGRMAKVIVEDLKSSYEMLIFYDVCARCEVKINSDEPLLIVARASREENSEVDVVAQEIFYLKEADGIMSKEAHFSIKADMVDKQQIEGLKRLISRFPGICRPIIHIEIPGKSLVTCRLADKYMLDPSEELIDEAGRLFGKRILSLR